MRKLLAPNHPAGLLIAPLVWTLHFVLCYGIVSLACRIAANPADAGIGFASLAIAAITAIALAGLAIVAWSNWRKLRAARQADDRISRFFAVNSLSLCALSTVSLIWVAFPALLLPTCAG